MISSDDRRHSRGAGLPLDLKQKLLRERAARKEVRRKHAEARAAQRAKIERTKARIDERVNHPHIVMPEVIEDDVLDVVRPTRLEPIERGEIEGVADGLGQLALKGYYDDAGYSGLRVRRDERFDRETWSLINRLCVPVPRAKW